jgi:uncharacterized protein YjbI with pentapeptide repeats
MGAELSDGKIKNSTAQKTSWPIDFSTLHSPPQWFATLATSIIIIVVFILLALAVISVARLAIDLLGTDSQRGSEAVKSLLPIVAAVIGLALIIWRLVILNQQTRISETKTQIDRETHYTSIFSKSVEQLGQTREYTETREVDEGLTTLIKTVPNIEVRLGGIHSLTRLAEESARDRGKIEEMLRSYIRENSWSDRDGVGSRSPHPSFPRRPSDNKTEKFAEWDLTCHELRMKQYGWARSLPETRVDVNEAIDAVVSMREFAPSIADNRFYESLFVRRSIQPDLLAAGQFERCTFINCNFWTEDLPDLKFRICRFIDSTFSGRNSKIQITRSAVLNTYFVNLKDSELDLLSSDIQESWFWSMATVKLKLPRATVIGSWIDSNSPISLDASAATLYKCNFDGMSFAADCDFERCEMIESSFLGADLSAVKSIEPETLALMGVDSMTIGPKSLERPSSWPEYNPKHVDADDVLF